VKRFVTTALTNFLLSGPPAPQPIVADCYTITLVTGEVFRLTSFDWGVTIAADATINQPGGTFTAMGSRIKRGRIQNRRGLETSQLDVVIGSDISPDLAAGALASPPAQIAGLSIGQAAIQGMFYGATIRLETVYGDPVSGGGLTRQPDGTYSDGGWGSVIKFVGIIANIEVIKQSVTLSCVSNLHYLDPYWPPFLIQPQCRWRLFDPGCSNLSTGTGSITAGQSTLTVSGITLAAATFVGRPITIAGAGPGGASLVTTIKSVISSSECTLGAIASVTVSNASVTVGLLAANFAVQGVVAASPASTTMQVYNSLTNPTGYFSSGRIVFVTGKNAGMTRGIRSAIASGPGAGYVETVLNDTPYVYYRLNDSVGASIVKDSSPNGYNGTVHGTITFGQPNMLVGESGGGAALFDGSTGFISCPAPLPPTAGQGVSFECWYKLSTGAAANQPVGIFDTDAGYSGYYGGVYGLRQNGYKADTLPGVVWDNDTPFVGFESPGVGNLQHLIAVFRGSNAIDVYINGYLFQTITAQGRGSMHWVTPFWVGKSAVPVYVIGPPPKYVMGNPTFFDGTMQDFAIYPYAISADQALAHYLAGSSAPIAGGAGVFLLAEPLVFAPAPGDQFVVYPGCDKLQRTCQFKFNNILQFGGMPYVPQPETGA
jgi:hypothetical protein